MAASLVAGAALQSAAQSPDAQKQNADAQKKQEAAKKTPEAKFDKNNPTAEQVAELVVFAYGSRAGLAQIRRTGVERGKITRTTDDGRPEEISYERTFKRGETFDKDKIRLDQHMPSIEYSLIYSGGKVFGVLRGSTFTPKQQDIAAMLSDRVHGLDALLRYKETGATVKYAGKDSQKGIDLWMLDLTDKEGNSTRYYISAKSWRVLWLEYEERAGEGAKPVKFRRTFHDYRAVQGTLVPYRSVLYEGDKQVEESQISTVTYGVKTEDSVFENSEAASS
ncbi:MAG TPA: hypothetical protein VE194_02755 [Rubrobacter sp.]|nr:hypothetical protein [Rubrobacter sp.]